MGLAVLLLLVGFVILIQGASFLVNGASSLAKRFNVSNLVIGLTVVAFGTSAPELVVNVISSISQKNDAVFGNIIGSNNFNLLLILGISGIIFPLMVQRDTVRFEIPISLLAAGVLYVLVNDVYLWGRETNILTRLDAGILLIFFGLFMMYIYRTIKRTDEFDQTQEIKIYGAWLSVGYVLLGLTMLVGGGTLVVNNAIEIARYFGLSEKLIGLTILAAGTSLPEFATSAVAAWKKNTDIAIGNVVGSNIFNILLILAISGLVSPIPFNDALNFDIYVLAGSTIGLMIFMFTLHQRKLDRWEAALMLGGYIVYTVYLISID